LYEAVGKGVSSKCKPGGKREGLDGKLSRAGGVRELAGEGSFEGKGRNENMKRRRQVSPKIQQTNRLSKASSLGSEKGAVNAQKTVPLKIRSKVKQNWKRIRGTTS